MKEANKIIYLSIDEAILVLKILFLFSKGTNMLEKPRDMVRLSWNKHEIKEIQQTYNILSIVEFPYVARI